MTSSKLILLLNLSVIYTLPGLRAEPCSFNEWNNKCS